MKKSDMWEDIRISRGGFGSWEDMESAQDLFSQFYDDYYEGLQADKDVLEDQLHSEIVGKEQMIVTYESRIQEMLEVIKFYADKENWDREGICYESKDDYTLDYGYKAISFLQKIGE